ncbi:Por secretion system C-terminal sorting domain-containing protein [Lishizhenia tianjinensis]|uniref:Por secretion system C-terminal sorting domain-containing protein n=2 Tax=Lishizhenia tianjinensis TaxID=477690 RepID=A0A1I6YEV0_9FLAO|nr:Por secretion system C-terminal sorting domain-containing protein [Lishizhenia tianjinensis]
MFCFVLIAGIAYGQSPKFNWDKVMAKYGQEIIPFSVPYTYNNLNYLHREGVLIKSITKDYILCSATPNLINEGYNSGKLSDFYLEFSNPTALDDTARALLFVDQVHQGVSPLPTGYTGEGVIIGFVDQGLDFTHPDFIDDNGNNRVIRYWDQGAGTGPNTPAAYGYGQVCDSASINDGTCPYTEESSAHGTTVTGIGCGNGKANGSNMGMAPDTKIIFIETNFSLPNWTLTVADACDYVFRVADSLGRPAVVNLSVGSYIGSHDGNDPASEMMEQLLDAKRGRLIVGAAGNSGALGNYHVRNFPTSDTSFIWLKANPNGAGGANTVLFDLWSDTADATYSYAYGADRPNNFTYAGGTNFRQALVNVGTPKNDTIYNANGDRIATIITYTEIVGGAFHIQGYFNQVDSTTYNFRFMTKGSGQYDLWSTASFGLSTIVENIPSTAVMPAIANYVLPDAQQSIVSSWNCSEKIVSVANTLCRTHHIDRNYNTYNAGAGAYPGELSSTSSKGPSRLDVIKPNISATGNVTLGAAPEWLRNNVSYYPLLDSGGYHARNGGTSMASPTVAGIGALMLEKCNRLSSEEFIAAIQNTAREESFMGALPNNGFGYGIVNALDATASTYFEAELLGDTVVCDGIALVYPDGNPISVEWYDNSTNVTLTVTQQEDSVWATYVMDERGCEGLSDTISLTVGTMPATPSITLNGNVLTSTAANNYQWFMNGSPLTGETNQTLVINTDGTYIMGTLSNDGCWAYSDSIRYYLGVQDEVESMFKVYPNPTQGKVTIEHFQQEDFSGVITNITGAKVAGFESGILGKSEIDLSELATGLYLCKIVLNNKTYTIKVIRE